MTINPCTSKNYKDPSGSLTFKRIISSGYAYGINNPLVVLAVAALVVYSFLFHPTGYVGDPNINLQAAMDGDWYARPIHFGYTAALGIVLFVFGGLIDNPFIIQGLFSAVTGAVGVYLTGKYAYGLYSSNTAALFAAGIFAFSGAIMTTATSGEPYIFQLVLMLAVALAGQRGQFFLFGVLWALIFTLAPTNALFAPIVLPGLVQYWPEIRSKFKAILVASAGFAVVLGVLAIVTVLQHPDGFERYYADVKVNLTYTSSVWASSPSFLLVQAAYIVRGMHFAILLAGVGAYFAITGHHRMLLLAVLSAVLTLVLNLRLLLAVDNYWQVMGILYVYISVFAGFGVYRLFEITRRQAANFVVPLVVAFFAVYAVISLMDMPQRDKAIADETQAVNDAVVNMGSSRVLLMEFGNNEAVKLQAEMEGVELDTLPTLIHLPAIVDLPYIPSRLEIIRGYAEADSPISLIARRWRYDSPLMRLVLGRVATGSPDGYARVLDEYQLTLIGPVGNYHALYTVELNP